MSAPQDRAQDAVAFELAAALESYEEEVQRLVGTWLDMELYASVSSRVDRMKMLSASLPQLAVPWVHLLISHAELIHCLWKCGEQSRSSRDVEQCRERHVLAITAMREKCLYFFTRMS
jgi:hypothetical protein